MTTKIEPITVLLISKNPFIFEATRLALADVGFLKLIAKDITYVNYKEVIAETKPDVMLLDFEFQNQPFELLEETIAENPKSMVVVILSEADMVNSDQVILSGARAFIQYPYQADNLIVTIKRVMELMVRDEDYLIRIPEARYRDQTQKYVYRFQPEGWCWDDNHRN